MNQSRKLPKSIKFSKRVSAYDDIALMPPPATIPNYANTSRKRNASNAQLENGEQSAGPAVTGTGLAKRMALRSDNAESQTSLVHNMMGDLDSMMQPEQITQGDTQTQSAYQQAGFEDAVTATPTTMRATPSTGSRLRNPVSKDMFPLQSDTQQEIALRKPYLVKSAKALARKAGGRTATGQMVLCQCGFGEDEGEMVRLFPHAAPVMLISNLQQVQCSYCSTWQHLHCYGYMGSQDPRLPEEHVCYWCLLGDTDVKGYAALQELAVQRRAMFYISKNGMRTKTDLSKALGE